MPTIDGLPAASACAASDEIMCSQGGISRKASLGQLLATTQPLIALQPGQLAGRFDAGAGGVEAIAIGANLTLANGALSAPAPFIVANLPPAATPGATDIVPLAQRNQAVGANYAQFMAGISGLTGITASAMLARADGATSTRTLAALFANAVVAEDFGAVGDGVSDDTAALANALASGQPVRLGPKTYCTTGQWTITGATAALIGVPGQTVLRRIAQSGNGAWISVQSTRFYADGVIFDANSAVMTDSWGILVAPSCAESDFHRCAFANARGATQGCGLVIQTTATASTQHAARACEAYGNLVHGIWSQAVSAVRIDGCRAHDNGLYGICLDYADPALIAKLQYCQIINCLAWNNMRGISVGNYNATNTTPPVWGNANPDAIAITIAGNICEANSVYGIAASGSALAIIGNQLAGNGVPGGAGILANVALSRICENIVTGGAQFGIDAGGSIMTAIAGNHVSGAVHGINPGGSQNMRIIGNVIQDCTGWSGIVNNVETDGAGRNFAMASTDIAITDNRIGFSVGAGGGGILLADNPQNILVARNRIVGGGAATVGQALWPHSNAVVIADNSWNFSSCATLATVGAPGDGDQLVYPDLLDTVLVSAAANPVTSVISQRQQALAGQIGFIAVTNGGAGYTSAHVAISGDGAGASAIAYVSNGVVIGIALTDAGASYTTASVTITGNGSGAGAIAQVGLPLLEQRRLTIRAAVPTLFARATASSPAQQSWTGYDVTLPVNGEIVFNARGGAWCAASVPLADYIAPDGAGGVHFATVNNGDLVLAPGGSGHVRIASSGEMTGISTSIGRGTPLGVVAAPPGSDYRNLNGGAGATLWIKQTGAGTAGWVAVA